MAGRKRLPMDRCFYREESQHGASSMSEKKRRSRVVNGAAPHTVWWRPIMHFVEESVKRPPSIPNRL